MLFVNAGACTGLLKYFVCLASNLNCNKFEQVKLEPAAAAAPAGSREPQRRCTAAAAPAAAAPAAAAAAPAAATEEPATEELVDYWTPPTLSSGSSGRDDTDATAVLFWSRGGGALEDGSITNLLVRAQQRASMLGYLVKSDILHVLVSTFKSASRLARNVETAPNMRHVGTEVMKLDDMDPHTRQQLMVNMQRHMRLHPVSRRPHKNNLNAGACTWPYYVKPLGRTQK